jgi:GMP synthase (glutamine-hydrolysing)
MILVIIMDLTPKIRASIRRNLKACISDVEFVNWDKPHLVDYVKNASPDGIILTGSSYRILDTKTVLHPVIDKQLLDIGIPVLGICYGYQTIIKHLVGRRGLRSYADIMECPVGLSLLKPFPVQYNIYKLAHHDDVITIPKGWLPISQIGFNPEKLHHANELIGCYDPVKKHMGIIFHPEKRKRTGATFFEAWQSWIQ